MTDITPQGRTGGDAMTELTDEAKAILAVMKPYRVG